MVERGGSHIASSSLLPLLNAFCPHRHEGKHERNTAQTTWFKCAVRDGQELFTFVKLHLL